MISKPIRTDLVSLILFQTLPTIYSAVGIVLALLGSTLVVYGDEKRGEVSAEEQGVAAAEEDAAAAEERDEATKTKPRL